MVDENAVFLYFNGLYFNGSSNRPINLSELNGRPYDYSFTDNEGMIHRILGAPCELLAEQMAHILENYNPNEVIFSRQRQFFEQDFVARSGIGVH